MQEIINELLDNALENGYDQSEAPAMDVAEDLVRFSAEVEEEDPKYLVPFVEVWQARQKNSRNE